MLIICLILFQKSRKLLQKLHFSYFFSGFWPPFISVDFDPKFVPNIPKMVLFFKWIINIFMKVISPCCWLFTLFCLITAGNFHKEYVVNFSNIFSFYLRENAEIFQDIFIFLFLAVLTTIIPRKLHPFSFFFIGVIKDCLS